MLNQCNFIGRLGADPESQDANGQALCKFSIACSEKYRNKAGEQVEETEWVNVITWGRLAEICGQYLHKGSLIYISGKKKTHKYEDKEGVQRYSTSIVAREMKMLGSKGEPQEQSGNVLSEPSSTGVDVPF